jgi:cellulose biosynthesis protein BcsQ
MKTLAVYSIKGGVGKTAAAVNLAYCAAAAGYKTLLWDIDPQAASTFYFRVKPKLKKGMKKAVSGRSDLENEIKATDYENLDIIPADFSCRNMDLFLDAADKPKKVISDLMKSVSGEYDLAIADAPPGITLLSESLIRAADVLAVPLIPTTLSLRTCEMLLGYLKDNKMKDVTPAAFFSMADRRKKIHREVMDDAVIERVNILKNYIPYSAEVEKMGINRAPVGVFSPKSRAAQAYSRLWQEIVNIL